MSILKNLLTLVTSGKELRNFEATPND
jgi:hypothetical protein